MNNESKIKFFRNKERNKVESKPQPYVPQHQLLGVEPTEFRSAIVPENMPKAVPSPVNPRLPRQVMRQPYANPVTIVTPIGKGKDVLPNVGNNVEHTWSSVDGELVDDVSLDNNHLMIDNNEFVSDSALNLTPDSSNHVENMEQESLDEFEESPSNDLLSVLEELQVTSYLLLVKGVPICSGPKEEIEEQVQALVFGEHELCDGEPVPETDKIGRAHV